jgi:hypothetical protein
LFTATKAMQNLFLAAKGTAAGKDNPNGMERVSSYSRAAVERR